MNDSTFYIQLLIFYSIFNIFFQIMSKLATTTQSQPDPITQRKKLKNIIQKKGIPKDNAFIFPETLKTKAKLKSSNVLFDDIDHLLRECNNHQSGSNSKSNSPQSHYSNDFFNSTLEAFNEDSSFVIVSETKHTESKIQQSFNTSENCQLQYIQEIFAQFAPWKSSGSKKCILRSNFSTDCTIESDKVNTSLNDFKQKFEFHEQNENPQRYNACHYEDDYPQFNRQQQSMFEINFERICDDARTTLMMRNIPKNYSKEMLIQEIDENFKGQFDFFNLHYDQSVNANLVKCQKQNVGYAFINLKDQSTVQEFYEHFNGKKWGRSNGLKICTLRYARVQRKQKGIYNELMQNYKRQQCFNLFVSAQHEGLKSKPYQGNNLIQIQQLIQSQREQCTDQY